MPNTKVSVIIPHWNGIDVLSECLDSLGKSTYKNIEIIVDGIDIPKINYPCKAIIKADDKIPEVMAASIVAKVHRDNLMIAFSKKYPDFSLEKNKGYPTKEHLNILKSLGPTKYHRKSFKPVLDAR